MPSSPAGGARRIARQRFLSPPGVDAEIANGRSQHVLHVGRSDRCCQNQRRHQTRRAERAHRHPVIASLRITRGEDRDAGRRTGPHPRATRPDLWPCGGANARNRGRNTRKLHEIANRSTLARWNESHRYTRGAVRQMLAAARVRAARLTTEGAATPAPINRSTHHLRRTPPPTRRSYWPATHRRRPIRGCGKGALDRVRHELAAAAAPNRCLAGDDRRSPRRRRRGSLRILIACAKPQASRAEFASGAFAMAGGGDRPVSRRHARRAWHPVRSSSGDAADFFESVFTGGRHLRRFPASSVTERGRARALAAPRNRTPSMRAGSTIGLVARGRRQRVGRAIDGAGVAAPSVVNTGRRRALAGPASIWRTCFAGVTGDFVPARRVAAGWLSRATPRVPSSIPSVRTPHGIDPDEFRAVLAGSRRRHDPHRRVIRRDAITGWTVSAFCSASLVPAAGFGHASIARPTCRRAATASHFGRPHPGEGQEALSRRFAELPVRPGSRHRHSRAESGVVLLGRAWGQMECRRVIATMPAITRSTWAKCSGRAAAGAPAALLPRRLRAAPSADALRLSAGVRRGVENSSRSGDAS